MDGRLSVEATSGRGLQLRIDWRGEKCSGPKYPSPHALGGTSGFPQEGRSFCPHPSPQAACSPVLYQLMATELALLLGLPFSQKFHLNRWFSNFLVLQPFDTVPHVVSPSLNIVFVAVLITVVLLLTNCSINMFPSGLGWPL